MGSSTSYWLQTGDTEVRDEVPLMLELASEQRIVLQPCSWATYERILADQADQSAPRFTYDRGALEIVSPSPEHENASERIKTLILLICMEQGLKVRMLGSSTQRKAELLRGVEPDSSFSFAGTNEPDLVVEIEVTRSSLDKLDIFAELGIPEVWRYDLRRLAILRLEAGSYVTFDRSGFLGLSTEDIEALLQLSSEDDADWALRVRDRLQGL
ncbi:Uma2 family endonuclease [bacterium CPR1]|nr:Uma2 family endonuclease [bacterium CPR1]